MLREKAGDVDIPQETLRRLQLTELRILEAIDDVCASHGIEYFLDSGTALGAVRHSGFIPWDDDIDVGMPRADYERFIALPTDALPEGISIHTYDNTPGFAALFAKVYADGTSFETAETREAGCPQGIFVDVFPYDELPSDEGQRTRRLAEAKKWQRMSYLYHAGSVTVPFGGALGACARAACRIAHVLVRAAFSREKIAQRFRAATGPAPDPSGECVTYAYPEVGPFPKEVLFPTARCTFEGRDFPVPHDAVRYLEIAYGSTWNELPPVEERRTHAPLRIDFGDR